jgi:hypothetical protein
MNPPLRAAILGSKPFAPTDIAGLKLWLAADRISGLNDGDPVGTWADLSGNANDATQATAAKKPVFKVSILNGKPVVRFDGVDDVLANTGLLVAGNFPASTAQMLVVFSIGAGYNPATAAYGVLGTGTSANSFWRYNGDGNGYLGEFRGARLAGYPVSMPTAGSHVFSLKSGSGAGSYEARIDGVSKGAQNSSWAIRASLLVGSDDTPHYLNGDIAEVLIYGAALSSADNVLLEKYLGTKYGITIS